MEAVVVLPVTILRLTFLLEQLIPTSVFLISGSQRRMFQEVREPFQIFQVQRAQLMLRRKLQIPGIIAGSLVLTADKQQLPQI